MSKKDFSTLVGSNFKPGSFNPFSPDQSGDKSLLMLDPKKLKLIEDQLVPGYSQEELQDLAENIKKNGVLESLVVRKLQNGVYEVLSGRNRCKAAILAGKDKVPCHVVEADDIDAEIIMYDANFERREDVPLSVKVKVYKRKYELLGEKSHVRLPEKIAEEMGISRASVFRYLKLGKLNEELLPLLDEGKLNLKAALLLASFNEEEQKKLTEGPTAPTEAALKEIKTRCDGGESFETAIKPKPKKKKEKKKQELTKESKEKILDAMQTYVSFVSLLKPNDKNYQFYRGAAAAINDIMCRIGQGELTEKLIDEMNRETEEKEDL